MLDRSSEMRHAEAELLRLTNQVLALEAELSRARTAQREAANRIGRLRSEIAWDAAHDPHTKSSQILSGSESEDGFARLKKPCSV